MNELIEAFNEYFEIVPVPANASELRAEMFRLRYEVLCEELHLSGFEPNVNRQEKDEYDDRSVHCLLRHRPTGTIAGTVRLILCDPNDPERPFPTEQYASHVLDPKKANPSQLPRQHTAEMSRFVLSKRFRSREGEDRYAFGAGKYDMAPHGSTGRDRRHFPHPLLGLMVGVVFMAAQQQITYWYASMEPVLNRLLRRFAVDLTPVGPSIEFHGVRQPHVDAVMAVLERTYKRRRDVWELVTDQGRLWPRPKT